MKHKLELTDAQMKALISVLDSASSIFQEDKHVQKEMKLIDRMLLKNGYKRLFR